MCEGAGLAGTRGTPCQDSAQHLCFHGFFSAQLTNIATVERTFYLRHCQCSGQLIATLKAARTRRLGRRGSALTLWGGSIELLQGALEEPFPKQNRSRSPLSRIPASSKLQNTGFQASQRNPKQPCRPDLEKNSSAMQAHCCSYRPSLGPQPSATQPPACPKSAHTAQNLNGALLALHPEPPSLPPSEICTFHPDLDQNCRAAVPEVRRVTVALRT